MRLLSTNLCFVSRVQVVEAAGRALHRLSFSASGREQLAFHKTLLQTVSAKHSQNERLHALLSRVFGPL